jgi:hypothetical protein
MARHRCGRVCGHYHSPVLLHNLWGLGPPALLVELPGDQAETAALLLIALGEFSARVTSSTAAPLR